MRKPLFLLSLLLIAGLLQAQGRFYTKTGRISFFSATALENIEAVNKSAVGILDTKTGDLVFSVLVKGFEFRKALMQEHFNGQYMESDQFPKSDFKGTVTNNSTVNYAVNGKYPVRVKGKLTIHGVTKEVETAATITVKDGKIQTNAAFSVLLADYNIKVPRMYQENISSSIRITVDCQMDPLK